MSGAIVRPRILKVVSILVIAMFAVFIGVCLVNEVLRFDPSRATTVVGDKAVLEDINFNDRRPVTLRGEWDVFAGVYLDSYDAEKLNNPQNVILPTTKIDELKGPSTYRVELQTGTSTKNLALFIPNFSSDITLYVDGQVQEQSGSEGGYWNLNLLGGKIFRIDLAEGATHELVFSVGKYAQENPLYMRDIIIGSYDGIYAYAYLTMANSIFLFGILIILTISAFVFVFLYPKYGVISLITLLDSFIVLRLLFGMGDVSDYIGALIGNFYFPDSLRLSLQIFFLMVAGVFGCLLARTLFDPKREIAGFLWKPLPWLYGLCAIVFSLRLEWFESFGVFVILGVFAYTGLCLFFQMKLYWLSHRNRYALLQIVKTLYFAIIVAVDIVCIPLKINLMFLAYAYLLFLFMHLVIRLYDTKVMYEEVEELNYSLEQKVQERTAELTRTNKTLAEMSIRDALTNAYNRLYFERYTEKAILGFDKQKSSLHLCMFDLDHFKKVNDTYGHDVGDEQLKSAVNTVNEIIDEDHAMFARIGGEEFVLVFNDLSTDEVREVLERIRCAFERDAQENPQRVTASFGLVCYSEDMTQKQLLKLADQCMYQAKEQGRNRIVCNTER